MSRNPFDFMNYVQPYVAVPLVADSGHVHQDRHTMVYQPPEGFAPVAKVKPEPTPEQLAQRARKNATYRRNVALRKNGYSDSGRTAGLTNSQTAPR